MEGKFEPLMSSVLIIVQVQSIAGKNEMWKMSKKIAQKYYNVIMRGSIIGSSLVYLVHFLSFSLRKGYGSNKRGSQTDKWCY